MTEAQLRRARRRDATARENGMSLMSVLVGAAILAFVALVVSQTIGSHISVMASARARSGYERLGGIVTSEVVQAVQTFEASTSMGTISTSQMRLKLINAFTHLTDASASSTGVNFKLVTAGSIAAQPQASACAAAQSGTRGRCDNQYAAIRRCNTMSPQLRGSPPRSLYFCIRAVTLDAPANQEMSFAAGGPRPQPVFVEIAYFFKDLTTGAPLLLAPAANGSSFYRVDPFGSAFYPGRGATIYYSMHWQKTVGRGASYHAFQGMTNVSHD